MEGQQFAVRVHAHVEPRASVRVDATVVAGSVCVHNDHVVIQAELVRASRQRRGRSSGSRRRGVRFDRSRGKPFLIPVPAPGPSLIPALIPTLLAGPSLIPALIPTLLPGTVLPFACRSRGRGRARGGGRHSSRASAGWRRWRLARHSGLARGIARWCRFEWGWHRGGGRHRRRWRPCRLSSSDRRPCKCSGRWKRRPSGSRHQRHTDCSGSMNMARLGSRYRARLSSRDRARQLRPWCQVLDAASVTWPGLMQKPCQCQGPVRSLGCTHLFKPSGINLPPCSCVSSQPPQVRWLMVRAKQSGQDVGFDPHEHPGLPPRPPPPYLAVEVDQGRDQGQLV
jgi:hypothetical protein